MNNCKYCGSEITNEGDFCGNCGYIKFYEEESVLKRLMKQFKYMFINPVAFIHTSRLANPIFTGFTAMVIVLIELIIIKGMGRKLHLDLPVGYSILATLGIGIIEALFMFVIIKGFYKKNVDFVAFLNVILSIQLISIIINIIGAMLGVIINPLLFVGFSVFGGIVCLLLIFQGIKDLVQAEFKVHLITLIGSFTGTTLVVFFILKILLQNAIRSIF